MTLETEQQEVDWTAYPILVQVSKNYTCHKGCRRKILAGSMAVKYCGEFCHYPYCPRNGRENKATVKGEE